LLEPIKKSASKFLLKKKKEAKRTRKGSDLHSASSIAILYHDSDENNFKLIRKIAKEIKDEFGVRNVAIMGWVNGNDKVIPIYQAHKLESDYFCDSDLSWKLQPSSHLSNFLADQFDILIDLVNQNALPVNYVLSQSKAKMKVGQKGSSREKYLDLIIAVPDNSSTGLLFREVIKVLSKLKIE